MIKRVYIILLGAGLWACSSVNQANVTSSYVKVNGAGANRIDSLIRPYHDTLEQEMGELIATSSRGMIAQRPGSDLMNWVADAVFANQTKMVRLSEPIFCLLNTGGIRSTINKGEVTLSDMFKLMPFDNEIVWVRMPASSITDIESFIRNSGGEPISNARVEQGKLVINGWRETTTSFLVITSDYLLNGGDKASFFAKRLEVNFTGKLMRNALIEEARQQKEFQIDTVSRISF
jgi:2',3'-cyclic-nucleotide 2'-phosphodiesterase (5'-nucleotidase family)